MQNSILPDNSGGATINRKDAKGGLGGFGEEETVQTERNFGIGGKRWPREETMALLKIRSEMDAAFRDSAVKAPLWDDVSRKLSEHGYYRSAKKCREKFENVFKYHKRTKECRSYRSNGKTYQFCEQLEALEGHHSLPYVPPSEEKINFDVQPISVFRDAIQCSIENLASSFDIPSTSTTSSSSKESESLQKKKRKLVDYVDNLMKQVVEKQENFQRQFLEAMEKCEQDRKAREEAWKMEELARIKRERELLVHERSIAEAKDAAVLALLQKFAGEPGIAELAENLLPVKKVVERQENSNGADSYMPIGSPTIGSSRWPKDEIEALIKLRTDLDLQYLDNAPKGPPLWEEISAGMKRLGYERNARRCKEKWENMNKYYKKVKERNKKRPEDSKTCPYFQQLDALYQNKSRKINGSVNPGCEVRPEELLMHMMAAQKQQTLPDSATGNSQNPKFDRSHENGHNEERVADAYGNGIVAKNSYPVEIIEC